MDQLIKVVTAQYFGVINYAIAVWYDALTKKEKQRMDVLHYKALRVVIKDWERLYPREILDLIGREKPEVYAEYAKASTFIKVFRNKLPKRLYDSIKSNKYRTRRDPTTKRFYNSAKKRVGNQALRNRIGETVSKLDNRWCTPMSDDGLRKYLKKKLFATT